MLSLPESPFYGWALAVLTIALFCISFLALAALGWQYGTTGGSPLEKFHPATYIAFALLLIAAALRGNPLTSLVNALSSQPLISIYLLGILGLTLHAAFVVGLPATGFVDTFVLPAVVYYLVRDISEGRRCNLALVIHAIFAVNSLLGVAEFVMGFRLTPLILEGEELEAEWRSTALMGHPLGNAMQTGGYMILLMIGGARDLPAILRLPAFLLAAAGMIVFGGRAATAFSLIAILYVSFVRIGQVLGGAKFDLRNVLIILVMLPALALVIVVLNDYGFFEQFMGRLVDDEGSASTRIVMFELFKHLSWYEFFFAPDVEHIGALMVTYGLDYGIESFWIAMILLHGLVVALAFFVCLFCFSHEVWRRAGPGGFLLLLYFYAVASASLSLSAKTPMLAIFVMQMLVLGNRVVPEVPRRPAFQGLPKPSISRRPARALSRRAG